MKLSYKLGLALLALLIPLVIVLYLFVTSMFSNMTFIEKEIQGVNVLQPVHKLLQKITLHRGNSAGALSGNDIMRGRLGTIQSDISVAFNQLYKTLEENSYITISSEVKLIEQNWKRLASENMSLSKLESVERHNKIVDDLIVTIKKLADISNLILDSELGTFYMMSAVVNETPKMANNLGVLRALGSSALTSQNLTSDERLELTKVTVSIFGAYENLKLGKEAAFKNTPELAGSLASAYDTLFDEVERANALVEKQVIKAESLIYSPTVFFDEMTKTISKIYSLNNAILPQLKSSLVERKNSEISLLIIELVFISIIVAIGFMIGFFVINQSVNSMHTAISVFKEIGKGKLDNKIDFSSKDEFGQLLSALGDMQGNLKDKNEEIGRLVSATQGMTTNLMMAGPDGIINYMNPSIVKMLKGREKEIQKALPNFAVDSIVGSSYDVFHKNPAHQRKVLQPENLPYRADIEVGSLSFELTAVALRDTNGVHLGTAVEWVDTTEIKAKNIEIGRLVSAIEGMTTNLMMAGTDGVINYMNPSIVKMLKGREEEIQKVLPNFSVDLIIGSSYDVFHKNPAHQRKILQPENLPYRADIEVGSLSFELTAVALKDSEGVYLGTAVEWVDTTELRAKNREIGRLVSATHGMTTCLMMSDTNGVINYLNPAVKKMLKKREDELKITLPNFDINTIIGSSFDVFHKNPAHQRKILQPENLPYNSAIKVGPLSFELTAVALRDADGVYLGTAVEWVDTTDIINAQEQIESLISDAARGDLSNRLKAESYSGFMKNLALGVNSMLDTVVEPIESCKSVLEDLAAGDLQNSMDGTYHGLFSQLQSSINTSIDNLRNMVGEIMETSSHVSTSSKEISQGNTDLSQRTEEQASSLEETASSMEELTGTVKENAEAAGKANKLSVDTMKLAESGGNVVSEAIDAMKEINRASKEISDIIGVIDEIAFQTNLLALNAAVEAARAGDQGRGFAVVAAEVRNLAQRSASAAKDIKSLINNSVSKVEQGSQLVNDSGQKLNDIVDSVRNVTQLVKEISSASDEQSSGIEQINQAVAQMDNMTQQNSALVEEAAASAESLNEQAGNLMELMSFFKTGEESGKRTKEIVSPVKPKATASSQSTGTNDVQSDQEWEEF